MHTPLCSFGQSAVFLIGGTTKQIRPTGILLQSGDIVIMSGGCRLAYHGVPKIVPPCKEMEVPHCLSREALWKYHEEAQHDRERLCLCLCGKTAVPECGGVGTARCSSCSSLLNCWQEFAAYLSYSRINVNVRQVVAH